MLELLIAMSIMVMVVGTLGVLAKAIQQSYAYTEGHGTATQHARVALDRIANTVAQSTTNDQFPGAIVVADTVGEWRFPDVLVVWRPTNDPIDPDGLPRFNELVIYCPNVDEPNELVELTLPGDTRTVPPVSNLSQWRSEISAIRTGGSGNSVTLTKLLRTCLTTDASESGARGAVRFETRLRPSLAEWDAY